VGFKNARGQLGREGDIERRRTTVRSARPLQPFPAKAAVLESGRRAAEKLGEDW
jgi:hypothetical protein